MKYSFESFRMLTGPEGSSFGFSLTSLGDANIDEYGDFCVGAPHFRMTNGRSGAVYMFNGQKKWSKSPTQIITADDIALNAPEDASIQGIWSYIKTFLIITVLNICMLIRD